MRRHAAPGALLRGKDRVDRRMEPDLRLAHPGAGGIGLLQDGSDLVPGGAGLVGGAGQLGDMFDEGDVVLHGVHEGVLELANLLDLLVGERRGTVGAAGLRPVGLDPGALLGGVDLPDVAPKLGERRGEPHQDGGAPGQDRVNLLPALPRIMGRAGLWSVEANGGEPRQLDSLSHGPAYQPAWSPSGARLAFWSGTGGQRDLETIPATGGPRVKVTNDAALDWAPVWSPDGKYLYFASDRGGAMGIWRIAVDETSGRVSGAPESVASGVDVSMDLPHLSKDGTALVFRSKIESVNPAAIAFDPASGRAGAVTLLQHRTGILVPADVSPDGQWLVLVNVPDRHQDLFLMHPDGTALTRLTDDEAADWFPRFTPDGTSLVFTSNRRGRYEAWSLRVDGSGRTRLTDLPGDITFAMFAPDGKRLAVARYPFAAAGIGTGPWPMTEKSALPLPGLAVGDEPE